MIGQQMTSSLTSETSQPPAKNSPTDPDLFAPVTDTKVIDLAIQNKFKTLSSARGELTMPCIPAMIDTHLEQVLSLLKALGQNLKPAEINALREGLAKRIAEGFQTSPHARLVLRYSPPDPTKGLPSGLNLKATIEVPLLEEKYERWVETREGPFFGSHPDAKLMAVAAELGDPATAPILDIGAGPGRNSLPLAKRGHPVDAVELTAVFAQQLLDQSAAAGLSIGVTQGDILDPRVMTKSSYYKLAIASEVISHFRSLDQVRILFTKLCDAVQPGGLLLFNLFLSVPGYIPDAPAREMSEVAWSYFLTPGELNNAMQGLPLEIVSNESVYEYERTHLPPEAWPPTGWFVSWATGRNVFPIKETPPIELRWILAKRR